MSLFTCELSGESGDGSGMVVTPSGHICQKSLLLKKLSENGGMDPFESINQLISEGDLVDLKASRSVIPPRSSTSSMNSLLSSVQKEYHAVSLELFDTRRLLEETRQELSQALYQNDSAIRVIARIALERDAARQQLEQLAISGTGVSSTTASEMNASNNLDQAENLEMPLPLTKKQKRHDLPLKNDILEEELRIMVDTWENLHKTRKAVQKELLASAPVPDGLLTNVQELAYHKTKCKNVVILSSAGTYLLSAGSDKQVIVFDASKEAVVQSFSTKNAVQALHGTSKIIVVASKGGLISCYSHVDGSTLGSVVPVKDAIIADVRIHPDGVHALLATKAGQMMIISLIFFNVLSVFESEEELTYTCGALHPDGLIYACGTAGGGLVLWDLKNRSLAATLPCDPAISVCVSENGYHIAVVHSESVTIWDLRKQKEVGKITGSFYSISFDVSGKYLALGGDTGVTIVTVKDQAIAAFLAGSEANCVAWVVNKVATSSSKKRIISLFG